MKIKYADHEHTQVRITHDDGRVTVGEKQQLINREFLEPDAVIEPFQTSAEALAAARTAKASEINSQAEAFVNQQVPDYPDFEKLTFVTQEAEARAYVADNTAAVPVLDTMAYERGLTVLELANRIITKADAFRGLTSKAAGRRQHYNDELSAATTVAEIEAIVVDYALVSV